MPRRPRGTTAQVRSRASCSPGISIRSSSASQLLTQGVQAAPEARVDRPRGRSRARRSRRASTRARTASRSPPLLGRSPASAAEASRPARSPAERRIDSDSSTSPRSLRARVQSMARLTTIRWSHGPNGRRRSKRSSERIAARNDSCAMSSAAAASWATRYAARYARGQCVRKSASRSETDPSLRAAHAGALVPISAHPCPDYDETCHRGPCPGYERDGSGGPGDLHRRDRRIRA